MNLQARPEPGRKSALLLTLLVHLGLLAALFIGVQWKNEDVAVAVELWSPVPQEAARPAPPPPPPPTVPEEVRQPDPPKKPDIVVKKEDPKPNRVEKTERRERPEPRTPDFTGLLDEELRDLQRTSRENERATLEAEAEEARRAAGYRSALETWSGKILEKVRGNITLPPNIEGNPETLLEVTLLPSGEILKVQIKRPSGNTVLDDAIERAFWKSSPLPKPDDPAVFRRQLDVTYRPY
jgi:colicin import membrane protein